MALKNIQTLTALTSGTLSINVSKNPAAAIDMASIARVSGVVTLTGNLNISPTGTPSRDTAIKILWEAAVTITPSSGDQVVIFGETVPDELVGRNFIAECVYDGAAWVVNILPDFAGVGIVDSDRLAANSVTLAKMDQGTTGSILAYNASGNIEEVDMATDGKLLIGVTAGKGYNAAVLSGDATLSTAGVLSLANNSVDTDELEASSVTTGKVKDSAVTAEKLSDGVRKDSFSIRLDFDDASKLGGQIFLPVCYNCTIDSVKATLVGAAGSDLTTIIKDAGGTVMTGSQIDVPSATVVGNVITSTVTGNNTMTAGTNMILEPSAAGTTAGHIHFTFCVTRDN